MARLMYKMNGVAVEPSGQSAVTQAASEPSEMPGNVREARLTVLRAVAAGSMPPEEADRILFPDG
jgi:hypothetical protein